MKQRAVFAWLWMAWLSLPASAALREIPVVPAAQAPAPALSPAVTSPGALPAPAAAADAILRYHPAVQAEVEPARLANEDSDGLRRLRDSLAVRGDRGTIEIAEALYYTDALTGLRNRSFFIERGAAALDGVDDPTVAMLDMNNFGAVNVALAALRGVTKGRARADAMLAVAGSILGDLSRETGATVVRLGGEEFVVLGSREKVLGLCAAAHEAMPPERLLIESGMGPGSPERVAVDKALRDNQRLGQPVGDFTYGVAPLGRGTLAEAVLAADEALNHAKEVGARGKIFTAAEGRAEEWTPPASAAPAESRAVTAPANPTSRELLDRLERRLNRSERRLFRRISFRDPLTQTRNYEYVSLQASSWDRQYAAGGQAALISARNFKQINDLLGHAEGDRYLRTLGAIMRREIKAARQSGRGDVQEPVRVASKEFLLIGKDAALVAARIEEAVDQDFWAGRMLPMAQIERLREKAVSGGHIPADRVLNIGTLRVVTADLIGPDGRTDSRRAFDRAFEKLEEAKRGEESGPR
jgi:GGDEF domain-containing protein